MNESRARQYFLVNGIAVVLLAGSVPALAQTKQEHVHHMAHTVMPFEMSRTLHVFKMTETGGALRVVTRKPDDAGQVELIRRHLAHEAALFQRGDYSDPASLHGSAMPGLAELQAGASDVRVSFSALADGAEITFQTADVRLLTAIHRWFGAQLREHGADARAE